LEIGKIVRYLPDQNKIKISASSQTVATVQMVPKICQASPQHLAHTVQDFIQIGSLLAELDQNV